MAFIRSNNANLMKAGLDAILFEPWEKQNPFSVIDTVYNVGTHDSQYKRWITIKGFPILTSKTEGAAYGSADASEAYYTDLILGPLCSNTYSKPCELLETLIRDNQQPSPLWEGSTTIRKEYTQASGSAGHPTGMMIWSALHGDMELFNG